MKNEGEKDDVVFLRVTHKLFVMADLLLVTCNCSSALQSKHQLSNPYIFCVNYVFSRAMLAQNSLCLLQFICWHSLLQY